MATTTKDNEIIQLFKNISSNDIILNSVNEDPKSNIYFYKYSDNKILVNFTNTSYTIVFGYITLSEDYPNIIEYFNKEGSLCVSGELYKIIRDIKVKDLISTEFLDKIIIHTANGDYELNKSKKTEYKLPFERQGSSLILSSEISLDDNSPVTRIYWNQNTKKIVNISEPDAEILFDSATKNIKIFLKTTKEKTKKNRKTKELEIVTPEESPKYSLELYSTDSNTEKYILFGSSKSSMELYQLFRIIC